MDIIAESTESDIFLHFFDATLIGNICAETNTNFSYLAENNVPPKSRLRRWHPVAVSEMYTLLATVMLMNHTRKYETTLYWSMNLILQTQCSDSRRQNSKILDQRYNTRDKFKSTVYPYRNLVINESVMLRKGRLYFKKYIPSEHTFSIKLFVICDCKTGYILDMLLHMVQREI